MFSKSLHTQLRLCLPEFTDSYFIIFHPYFSVLVESFFVTAKGISFPSCLLPGNLSVYNDASIWRTRLRFILSGEYTNISDTTMRLLTLSKRTWDTYGSPKVAAYHRKSLDLPTNFSIVNSASEAVPNRLSVVNCTDDEVKVEFSKPDPEAGKAALGALEKAIEEYKAGLIDVIVTAPINKHTIQSEEFSFPGHTEYIEEKLGDGGKALMILMKDDLRVA